MYNYRVLQQKMSTNYTSLSLLIRSGYTTRESDSTGKTRGERERGMETNRESSNAAAEQSGVFVLRFLFANSNKIKSLSSNSLQSNKILIYCCCK
jgi:hypothetical protein